MLCEQLRTFLSRFTYIWLLQDGWAHPHPDTQQPQAPQDGMGMSTSCSSCGWHWALTGLDSGLGNSTEGLCMEQVSHRPLCRTALQWQVLSWCWDPGPSLGWGRETAAHTGFCWCVAFGLQVTPQTPQELGGLKASSNSSAQRPSPSSARLPGVHQLSVSNPAGHHTYRDGWSWSRVLCHGLHAGHGLHLPTPTYWCSGQSTKAGQEWFCGV